MSEEGKSPPRRLSRWLDLGLEIRIYQEDRAIEKAVGGSAQKAPGGYALNPREKKMIAGEKLHGRTPPTGYNFPMVGRR